MSAPRRLLFLVRRPPYEGLMPQESLDLILSAAAFDQVVGLMFLDDGVLQLLTGQQAATQGPRNLGPVFALLETYGAGPVWVEQESLTERGLCVNELVIPVQTLSRRKLAGVIEDFDIIVSC